MLAATVEETAANNGPTLNEGLVSAIARDETLSPDASLTQDHHLHEAPKR